MATELEPYPTYKDSGVPWLGQVPEQWDIKRNKLFLREVNQRSEDGTEELLTVSQYTGVTRRRERSLGEGDLLTHATSLVGHKRVSPGDLVVNIMLAWNGSLGVSSLAGIVSPAYCVYRAGPQSEPRFLHYLYRTPLFTGAFKTVSTGVVDSRLRLYPDVFFDMSSLLPPLPEQMAIVRYLDHADRKVRHAVRARQQLIKLLTEQKRAIIQRAVTRGLDPSVRLKPSGVPRLGDVPKHWEARRLKTVSHMKSGESITGLAIDQVGEYPVYGGNGLRGYTSAYTHDGEYALIGRQGALCGNVHQAHGRFWASEHAVVASLRDGYGLSWFCSLLDVMNLNQYSMAAAQPGLAVEQIMNLWIPVPPADEQGQISDYLDGATANVDKAIDAARREIELLREYRIRLIADVVTGKLDVRDVPVPEDETDLPSEELETIDDVDVVDQSDDAAEDDSESSAEESA